jgi:hypothetical protein
MFSVSELQFYTRTDSSMVDTDKLKALLKKN